MLLSFLSAFCDIFRFMFKCPAWFSDLHETGKRECSGLFPPYEEVPHNMHGDGPTGEGQVLTPHDTIINIHAAVAILNQQCPQYFNHLSHWYVVSSNF